MNRQELVAAIAKDTNLGEKDVNAVVKSFINVVTNELQDGGRVQLIGFGTFDVNERGERAGHDPRTGNTITIKAAKLPRFKAGKALKEAVNK